MSSVRRSAGLRFQHNCHTHSGIASTLTPHRQLIDALESDLEAVESKSRRRCPNGDLSLRFGITAVAGRRERRLLGGMYPARLEGVSHLSKCSDPKALTLTDPRRVTSVIEHRYRE